MLNFSFFSESALGKIFYLIVSGLYTHELYKNAKNRIVISFLSQILCETVVIGPDSSISCFPQIAAWTRNSVLPQTDLVDLLDSLDNSALKASVDWPHLDNQ